MSRQIYVNGRFVSEAEAVVSVFDRGFLFADGIYEVSAVVARRLVDNALHLARLERSLAEVGIPMPLGRDDVAGVQAELVRRNRLEEGVVYLQVTRGAAERDFGFAPDLKPSFVAFTQQKPILGTASVREGIAVGVEPDLRWARRDIKTVMLLTQVLAKQAVKARGFGEAWLVEDGYVTEGASSTGFVVTADGALVSRPDSHAVLPGCTKAVVLDLARAAGLRVEARRFTVEEAQQAREAFLTSASSTITPVVRIEDRVIGDGRPGPLTLRLQQAYVESALRGPALF
ncbi:D-amino acid aminotransferase [Burkholderia sp. WAC0059]|uniref:D-amino-acid transaminase n=1 Tax=Burkholderia sp. WAC0059 TaxID=2066022 RepID=UPI000C7EAAB5|nr:D-amino-acid transaminase [Burkholderia sp. WAC0059]PLZ02537.1 D-amino acid aminotransferase [Burkholderia sp. WAC0059]